MQAAGVKNLRRVFNGVQMPPWADERAIPFIFMLAGGFMMILMDGNYIGGNIHQFRASRTHTP